MNLVVYGIANCDSCRKTRKWLATRGIEHRFHDLRQDGVEPAMLQRWSDYTDWKSLLNTRSRTWREISADAREDLDAQKAMHLMRGHPTLIKRPVIEADGWLEVGFSETRLTSRLQSII